MHGGTHLRSTSAGLLTLSGIEIPLPKCRHIHELLTLLTFSAAVAHLENTQGYIVVISSTGAQLRVPGTSDSCISKFAVNRLVEFIALGIAPPFFVGNLTILNASLAQSTLAFAHTR